MNGPDKHSDTFLFGGMILHIDGIPDECEHDWTGQTAYFDGNGNVYRESEIGDPKTESRWTDLGIIGGAVTCAKCGKIFEPDLFMDENPES